MLEGKINAVVLIILLIAVLPTIATLAKDYAVFPQDYSWAVSVFILSIIAFGIYKAYIYWSGKH
jgi:hypothetical protein